MITIPQPFQKWLCTQPEYGMGYQRASVKLSTGGWESGVILNSATFAKQDDIKKLSAADFINAERAAYSSLLSIVDIKLIPRPLESLRGVLLVKSALFANRQGVGVIVANEAYRASQGAKDAPITMTLAGEIFMRFSAYVDDRRITEKQALRPGTFATTAQDAINVHTGREAIARYALENKKSANKRFSITPKDGTKLKRGEVQPAYGEPGGGIEVIFVDGTCDFSVKLPPDILPE